MCVLRVPLLLVCVRFYMSVCPPAKNESNITLLLFFHINQHSSSVCASQRKRNNRMKDRERKQKKIRKKNNNMFSSLPLYSVSIPVQCLRFSQNRACIYIYMWKEPGHTISATYAACGMPILTMWYRSWHGMAHIPYNTTQYDTTHTTHIRGVEHSQHSTVQPTKMKRIQKTGAAGSLAHTYYSEYIGYETNSLTTRWLARPCGKTNVDVNGDDDSTTTRKKIICI